MAGDWQKIDLPGIVTDVAVGGAGRYVILRCQEKLEVFDVSAGKLTGSIELKGGEGFEFAAGARDLYVLLTAQKKLQRWDLESRDLVVEREISYPGELVGVATGSATFGPVLVYGHNKERAYLEGESLEQADYKLSGSTNVTYLSRLREEGCELRVSANGATFASSGPFRTGLLSINVDSDSMTEEVFYQHKETNYAIPSADGKHVFTHGGVYTFELNPVGEIEPRDVTEMPIPAVSGGYYLTIPSKPIHSRSSPAELPPVKVHFSGYPEALFAIPEVNSFIDGMDFVPGNSTLLSPSQRYLLVPEAMVLIECREGEPCLILHRVDLEQKLEESDAGYLFVETDPQTDAEVGTDWKYKPVVRSKAGGVTVEIEVGPDGMVMVGDQLEWPVPELASGSSNPVVLLINDESGQEVFHRFNISVGGEKPVGEGPSQTADAAALMKHSPPPEILPPDFGGANQLEVNLPAPVAAAKAGGGGRFILMHFPDLQQLGVFDVNSKKIEKFISLSDNEIYFAAGLTKLVIVQTGERLLTRWDLTNFERESTVAMEPGGRIFFAEMGASSDGDVVIGEAALKYGETDQFELDSYHPQFYRLDTLERYELNKVGQQVTYPSRLSEHSPIEFRASADGNTFVNWDGSGQSFSIFRKTGNSLRAVRVGDGYGPAAPLLDGTVCSRYGVWNKDGERAVEDDVDWYLPAVSGDYFLRVSKDPQQREAGASVSLGIRSGREFISIGEVENVAESLGQYLSNRSRQASKPLLPISDRYFFVPEAKLLASFDWETSSLQLHRIDAEELSEKSGVDFLAVSSIPPARVSPGGEVNYGIEVAKSEVGSLAFSLESGPEGMAVSPEGVVTWSLPDNAEKKLHSIILRVTGENGRSVFHTFLLEVE